MNERLRVTQPLNVRSGPGMQHPVVDGMFTGTEVTATGRSGKWVQFERSGRSVWSHGDYLE
ncbi:SH3 domain-containing protein [Nesterenkonia pannonica]|uniref:SH3 domain-containing protein n=1 Tax=Nesterenkonia pannonica TaxID=1548602 RepID=UPI002164477E|nr:SH3 domain-containing protein [Nesterenkonia pannonica]